ERVASILGQGPYMKNHPLVRVGSFFVCPGLAAGRVKLRKKVTKRAKNIFLVTRFTNKLIEKLQFS
ncbi:MAG: hypothetical protein MJZ25_13335, partial [Fibrobacter sp.]|nr:hypothetical protein [Fibrobacter sp.]